MRRLPYPMITLAAGLAAVMTMALGCSARPGDYEEDFTQEVERICADYCSMNLACHEPTWFETYEGCEEVCLETPFVYNDTDCGEARRDLAECVGSTTTCELYNDTNNVHADEYTCKTEKEHYLGLDCGQSDEDPQGSP